jgi:predicted RNA-binding Zn-ribbon protein involved in translation (DUF1610 family)
LRTVGHMNDDYGIEDGEICPSCGEVPLVSEDGMSGECPNCGAQYTIDGGDGDDWG